MQNLKKTTKPGFLTGFTLIELLVVIGCIMILAAITVVALTSFTDEAKTKATQTLLSQIEVALNSYHTVFLSYPPSEGRYDGSQNLYYFLAKTPDNENTSGIDNLSLMVNSEMKKLSAPLELKKKNLDAQNYLVDAWGQRIVYKNPGQNHPDGHNNSFYVDLESYGPNSVPDNDYTANDDDINNWKLYVQTGKKKEEPQPKPKTEPQPRTEPKPKTEPKPRPERKIDPKPESTTKTCPVCNGKKNLPHESCSGTGEVTVPHEFCSPAGMAVCPKCKGDTKITDPKCKGTGKITDQACGGKGTITNACPTCTGSGIQFDPLTNEKKPCPTCNGQGKITETCSSCQGTGKVTDPSCQGTGKITDPTCQGTGQIICPVCKGTKETKQPDQACNGTGKISCATCNGTGVTNK